MKKKKLLIFTCLLIVLTLTLFSFAGCQKFSLSKLKNNDYTEKDDIFKVKTLNALSGYNFVSMQNGFIVADKKNGENQTTETVLYNAESEKILLSLTEDITAYSFSYYDGTALVRNTLTEHVDLYDKDGVVFSADNTTLNSSSTNGFFRYLYFSNGKTVMISTENGDVRVSDTKIGGAPSNIIKVGDYYFESIGGESGFVLAIYDKNMNFKRYFDIESQIKLTEADKDATTAVLKNNKVLFTLATLLPDDSKSYDFMNGGKKYNNRSYIIDFNKLSVSEVDPEYFISGMASETLNYNVLYFQDLSNKTMSTTFSLGVFDDDLKLLFDFSDYLTDIDSVEPLDNGNILLKNKDMAVVINKDGDVVSSYSLDNLTEYGSLLLQNNGNVKVLYDKYGKEVLSLDNTCELVTSLESSKYIYYLQSTEISGEDGSKATEKIYMAYDINTRTAKELGKDITLYPSLNAYEISIPVDDAVLKSLYSAEDGKAIYENLTNAVTRTYSDSSNRLMTVTTGDATTFYYFYR